ncbi:MAG: ABC transporter ATP-binding protein [Acidimicrobiales bacterium]
MTPSTSAIEVRHVTCRFGAVAVLDDAALAVAAGRLVVVLGPSGSGKTTMLNVMCGWQRPERGEVRFRGETVGPGELRWSELAVIPQVLGLLEELTAAENVALPCRLGHVPVHDAQGLMEQFDLVALADRLPSALSLGERQRVAVARALVGSPTVLLADEPTSHQDRVRAAAVIASIRRLVDQGMAAVVCTHDAELVEAADDVFTMQAGRLAPAR